MSKNLKRRVISLIISLVMCTLILPAVVPAGKAQAASKYITVEEYIKHLVTEMKLQVDESQEDPYIEAAKRAGILKDGDFTDYSANLTRTDCAVLANRADEYIYGSHYGYADEIYELLKDCEYYQGKLYYNTKGKLYPAGENDDTYQASRFLEDVVLPRFSPYFRFDRELKAMYHHTYDLEDNVTGLYLEIGFSPNNKTLPYTNPIEEDNFLIQAWKKIIDGDRRVKAVYEKRISDINKITKSKRQDVAEIVAKGIIKGYSKGMYVQNREFRGEKNITAAGAKGVVEMILYPEKRARINPDGQLIRTTNLPNNAHEYPYILECFPNDFYEMDFQFEYWIPFKDGTLERSEYAYPVEIGNKGLCEDYAYYIHLGMDPYEYFDKFMEQAEQFVTNVLNVDYRTVDKEWIETVAGSYSPFGGESIYDWIDEYIKDMKKNHVVVESQIVSVEPSTLYYDGTSFSYYVRVYAKYRVIADTVKVENDNDLIFGNYYNTNLRGLKNSEWTDGYYDIELKGSNWRDFRYLDVGVGSWAGISDRLDK